MDTTLKLRGWHDTPESVRGAKWSMTIKDQKVRLTDYSTHDGEKKFSITLDNLAPIHYPGTDQSGKSYEIIEWTGEWVSWHNKYARLQIQTWDRVTFFVWAIFPHKRFTYRGADVQFTAESMIVTLDNRSYNRLAELVNWIEEAEAWPMRIDQGGSHG